ncbi:MAG: tRNA epoxyqueuosine(34) reductase QueG [Gammaproteobacteria bacterium]
MPEVDEFVELIRLWGKELGFDDVGVTRAAPAQAEKFLKTWLERGFHGEMEWMSRHGNRRTRPDELIPGTLAIVSARLDYLGDTDQSKMEHLLGATDRAYISRYALGRDYHKLMRKRLAQLAERIRKEIGRLNYRVFSDSAPVMEKALAEQAGLGWIGKHTNLINSRAGSWFFLGEIYTDLPLPAQPAAENHCGSCDRCLTACPTQAIVAPYQLDARRCISYLTIELEGPIPVEFRKPIGNRIYGCDDCQLVCPWNRFARRTDEADFLPRNRLDDRSLLDLFNWSETEFNENLLGSAIRRIGHTRWLRNIAVALGNCVPASEEHRREIISALTARLSHPSELVTEHVRWALSQLAEPAGERPSG